MVKFPDVCILSAISLHIPAAHVHPYKHPTCPPRTRHIPITYLSCYSKLESQAKKDYLRLCMKGIVNRNNKEQ